MVIVYTKPRSKWAFIGHLIRIFSKNKNQKFKNVPSHMALVFQEVVLEARAGGVILTELKDFRKKNEIIKTFRSRSLDMMDANEVFNNGILRLLGRGYDYLGVLWYGFFLLRRRIFKLDLPDMSLWQSTRRFYCSELIKIISDSTEYKHLTPNDQMNSLKQRDNYYQVNF